LKTVHFFIKVHHLIIQTKYCDEIKVDFVEKFIIKNCIKIFTIVDIN